MPEVVRVRVVLTLEPQALLTESSRGESCRARSLRWTAMAYRPLTLDPKTPILPATAFGLARRARFAYAFANT
jgi:hypothetical protein